MAIRALDLEELHQRFEKAQPFRHVLIDDFVESQFAQEVASAFPGFEESLGVGTRFETVNEHRKVQVTDPERFPGPIRQLHQMLASSEFLAQLSHITGIPRLQSDPELSGGGIHQTAARGRLDVHVDFNYLPHLNSFRRLNLLLYLNPGWKSEWGGEVELWDPDVEVCHEAFEPIQNRCLIFETHQTSYHGVRRVTCPPGSTRNSYSAYYYTFEPPPDFQDDFHGTLFRARPHERFKRFVLMPGERLKQRWRGFFARRGGRSK